jgi:signal transduction histidine kinase
VRALAGHLSDVLEDERARISREVHDDLGQTLTAMRLEIDAAGKVPALVGLVERALDGARRIMSGLRPRALDELGLVAAIEQLAEEFRARTGTACELSIDPDVRTDPKRAMALYRIVQESLSNVTKHARATAVEITLAADLGVLRLLVRDDGAGLPKDVRKGAMGLVGMRERARQFGGRVEVSGAPGKGTVVDVEIPMTESEVAA